MQAIDAGESVLVSAPTGAGKTLIADFAIHRALATGHKAMYTTPLKALSNQKHRDLCERLGGDRVGLLTGDRSVNIHAPIVVMTTEVLRALLYDGAELLRDLGVIVLDEFHYLQDPERGPVWEEVVIEAPADVALVCLSATIPDVDAVASWLRAVHGPTAAVVEGVRPVPLEFLYAIGNLHRAPPLLFPMFVDGQPNPVAELKDGVRKETRGEGLRIRDRDRPVTPTREGLLDILGRENKLPVIWFVLSRAGCDRALEDSVDRGIRLTDVDEARAIRALVDDAAQTLTPSERRALGWGTWSTALAAGISTHHGGMTPLQRELVELAYAEGLLKVTFATETLALGVNLPAKTVVIDRVTRPDGDARTPMTGTEFAQLAGRAGRRGLDAVGHVVVPWAEDVGFHRVAGLAGGRLPALVSHFEPTPSMVANLLHRHDPDSAKARCRAALAAALREREAAALRGDIAALEATLDEPDETADDDGAAVPARVPREHDLSGIHVGDVIVDPARPHHGSLAVVDVGRAKGGGISLHTVRSDCRRVVLNSRDFRSAPLVVAHLDVSGIAGGRGHAREVALMLLRLPPAAIPEAAPAPPRGPAGGGSGRKRIAAQRDALRFELAELDGRMDRTFDAVVRLLRRRGHLDGWRLTESGAALRRVFHVRGLVVAESLVAGAFDDLDPAALASLTSVFLEERKAADLAPGRMPLRELERRWTTVRAIAEDVAHAAADEGLPSQSPPTATWAGGIHRWASGAGLDEAMAGSELSAGDLVRVARQVADLLEQIADAEPRLRAVVSGGVNALLRGAVVAEGPALRELAYASTL